MNTAIAEGAACTPNISAMGRRSRRRLGITAWVVAAVALAACVALDAPWWARALVFVPAGAGAGALLEASRMVCLIHARAGVIEDDNDQMTAMAAADLPATRRVATTVLRDALLIGAVAGLVSALTAFV